jgi:hypothetical protein
MIHRWELDLAEDRNYIPVRMRAYTPEWSNDFPVGEAEVLEMREIAPGIWFPFSAVERAYDKRTLQSEQRFQVRWQEQYVTEAVSLHPAYDTAYFRDVVFPPGTNVYEVEDNKITRSYAQGGPSYQARAWSWWILVVNVAVVLLALAWGVTRRRRLNRT